jgi:hypothetical protein
MVAVGLGREVEMGVSVVMAVGGIIGEDVAVTAGTHAISDREMPTKNTARNRYFMFAHFLCVMRRILDRYSNVLSTEWLYSQVTFVWNKLHVWSVLQVNSLQQKTPSGSESFHHSNQTACGDCYDKRKENSNGCV